MKLFYPAQGIVSIWVGTFESEDIFDACVDRDVSPQLGLNIDISSICEIGFEPEPKPIENLLDGFSGCSSFVASAVNAAASHGITSANSALVCFHLECRDAPVPWGGLMFLGSMSGTDIVS